MKRFLLFLLALCLLPFSGLAAEDEELTIEEILLDADPSVTTDTLVAPVDEEETPVSIYEPDGSVLITITGTGDFTVGGDSRKKSNIFDEELRRQKGDIQFPLKNIRDTLLADDLTIVNFEGTLTNTTSIPSSKKENQFLFSAPPEYVAMLTENGIEAVSLENNHVMDHGTEGFEDTQNTLREAGVVYSTSSEMGVIEVKGIQIAMLSYLCIDRYDQLWDVVPADIAKAKQQYPIVIVSFHWGNETYYEPTKNQIKMGRLAVDAGADLVLGHHSHRIQPIEQYKGVYICYSLGNFCFAGNRKPSDMTSYLFQTRFRVKDGNISNEGFRIIPIRISSRSDRNDFIPTLLDKSTAVDSIMSTLKSNGKSLEYAVESYPTEWDE